MADKGQNNDNKPSRTQEIGVRTSDFVLDKSIFSNVFDKDIRRIYIYRKSERLAKAIHLITPAFASAPSLRNRLDAVAMGLIDAAVLSPSMARTALSKELLTLSSLLSVARTGGLISAMNADLIIREAHILLQETASYEEPRLFMDDAPTLAELSKQMPSDIRDTRGARESRIALAGPRSTPTASQHKGQTKGHISDNIIDSSSNMSSGSTHSARQEAILEVLRSKGPLYIKDISTVIRDVSEKTIQRELQTLVTNGVIQRVGERRWTQYSISEPI
jgi:DNA-binding transcriptional ArsR family regulator